MTQTQGPQRARTGRRDADASHTSRDPAPDSRHGPIAQLLIAWSPLSLILLAYAAAQWVSAPLSDGDAAGTNRLGFRLHVEGPARADEAAFGVVPSVWLQERLVDGNPHWYDAAAALVYVTHFISIPLLTAFVWFRWRERFGTWLVTVLTFITVGVAGYVLYPAAPPWLASERGDIGAVARVSSLGWDYLHLDFVAELIGVAQDGSNPVAAMPSLHAGCALLVALFLWARAGAVVRAALLVYALSMTVTLVYTGEHYVVDAVAGWAVALVALAVGAGFRNLRSRAGVSAPG